ncbi:unnamed protein product [Anisakis simplex]|uniref:Secreted protein n=1 Tax=Anisakis simplex TaxID=6269 RepID=A0A0M3IY50_ANISI|nr:unnamed protein product [Anisakis simplex]
MERLWSLLTITSMDIRTRRSMVDGGQMAFDGGGINNSDSRTTSRCVISNPTSASIPNTTSTHIEYDSKVQGSAGLGVSVLNLGIAK